MYIEYDCCSMDIVIGQPLDAQKLGWFSLGDMIQKGDVNATKQTHHTCLTSIKGKGFLIYGDEAYQKVPQQGRPLADTFYVGEASYCAYSRAKERLRATRGGACAPLIYTPLAGGRAYGPR